MSRIHTEDLTRSCILLWYASVLLNSSENHRGGLNTWRVVNATVMLSSSQYTNTHQMHRAYHKTISMICPNVYAHTQLHTIIQVILARAIPPTSTYICTLGRSYQELRSPMICFSPFKLFRDHRGGLNTWRVVNATVMLSSSQYI